MNSTLRTVLWWLIVIFLVLALWRVVKAGERPPDELTFTEFLGQVEKGHVESVTIEGANILGVFTGDGDTNPGQRFRTYSPDYPDLVEELRERKVEIKAQEEKGNLFLAMLVNFGPILIIVALWIFFMRQMQAGGSRAMSFGKSRAKLLSASTKKITFQDVAGVEEAKEELWEVVEFLKEPQKFQKLGGKIPKGVLLMGPPGTGKTLLARAIAGEANVPFFSISGSDFVEMFVGVGASRVRDLFEQGKKNAPCIIFIDEIDAVGRHRGAGLGGGHDEREQTLNQLLVEMDGFETNEGVILIAATNRPDVLDPALLRPGRFDRRVVVDRPDINGRLGILEVHARQIPMADDVDLGIVARGTPGFAGADLANLVNEAALIAARRNQAKVDMAAFDFAKDKVLMGVERKTLVLTDHEKLVTAYHEAGHALVAAFCEGADPLHKITIIPRGRALGLTMQLPLEDKHNYSKKYLETQLAILMGGRVAEEITIGDITTGASSDIERATQMARNMVCSWGMSKLGPLAYGNKDEPVFIGRELATRSDYSDITAEAIDREIRAFVDEGHRRATEILGSHRELLEETSRLLLDEESISGEAVYAMIQRATGDDKRPPPPAHASPSRGTSHLPAAEPAPAEPQAPTESESKDSSPEKGTDQPA